MMEKEFVPYAESLELKELGFDEPCFGWYDGRYIASINQNYCKNSEEWLNTIHCAAPLYQQAFRWFREKYNLYHVITIADLGKYESGNPDFQCAIYSKDPVVITNMDNYNTYEGAELECLVALINIVKINIVKKQNLNRNS